MRLHRMEGAVMAGVHDSRFPAHLEALRVPLLDTVDAGHLGQAIGKRLELDDTMGQTNRQLLAKELRGLDERSLLLGVSRVSRGQGGRCGASRDGSDTVTGR